MDAFNLFDTNHDGTINSQKIGEIMRKLGKNPTEQQLLQLIGNVTITDSKKITFDDFVDLMEKKIRKMTQKLKLLILLEYSIKKIMD